MRPPVRAWERVLTRPYPRPYPRACGASVRECVATLPEIFFKINIYFFKKYFPFVVPTNATLRSVALRYTTEHTVVAAADYSPLITHCVLLRFATLHSASLRCGSAQEAYALRCAP